MANFKSIPQRVGLAIAGGAAVLMLWAALPSIAQAATCPKGAEVDYLAPLEGLPPTKQLPKNGHLPFAPKHLIVRSASPLLAGGGPAGVLVESDDPKGSYRLGWTVAVTVSRITSAGSIRGLVGKRMTRLWQERSFWKEPARLQVRVPAQPGLYKSEIAITVGDQKKRTFGQYLRVVPRKVDVRLSLDKATYAGGETVSSRLENRGTVGLSYGPGMALEFWNGGDWQPVEGQPEFFGGPATELAAGAAGRCERVTLPVGLRPGQYRLTKTVAAGRKGGSVHGNFSVP